MEADFSSPLESMSRAVTSRGSTTSTVGRMATQLLTVEDVFDIPSRGLVIVVGRLRTAMYLVSAMGYEQLCR
jgi:hypothetical protein